jgi:hypothetical protein
LVVPIPDQPDPHGLLAWISAILETLKQAYAALLIPTAAAVAWFVKRWDTRRDDAVKREDARRQSEEDAHQRISDQLDRESAERFEAMRAENVRLRSELDISRAQARAMEEWAHWARHGWLNCKSRYRAFRRIVARANQSPVGFTEIARLLTITKPRKIPVMIPPLGQVVEKTPPEEPEELEDSDDLDEFPEEPADVPVKTGDAAKEE